MMLSIVLCSAMQISCDEYIVDYGLTKQECVFMIKTETMPFFMEQIFMLESFNEANCSSDNAPIRKLKFI